MDGFQLGPLRIYWYSICLLAAVWVGYAIALRDRPRSGLSQNALTDLVAIVLVAGVVGGRLGYVAQNSAYFSTHWLEIFLVASGGLSIHGAVLAGAVAAWRYAKKHDLTWLKLTDLLVIPLLAGQIIGRLGNYFNQELYGYPTQVPWKIFIAPENRLATFQSSTHFHPTFLYEMVLNAIGFLIISRWKPNKTGQLTGAYLVVFALSRLVVEIWRISDRQFWNLSSAQIVSLLLLAASYPLLSGTADNVLQKINHTLTNLRENWDRSGHKKY